MRNAFSTFLKARFALIAKSGTGTIYTGSLCFHGVSFPSDIACLHNPLLLTPEKVLKAGKKIALVRLPYSGL